MIGALKQATSPLKPSFVMSGVKRAVPAGLGSFCVPYPALTSTPTNFVRWGPRRAGLTNVAPQGLRRMWGIRQVVSCQWSVVREDQRRTIYSDVESHSTLRVGWGTRFP